MLRLIYIEGSHLVLKQEEQKRCFDCSEGSKRVCSTFDRRCLWLGSKRDVCLRLLGSKADSLRHRIFCEHLGCVLVVVVVRL